MFFKGLYIKNISPLILSETDKVENTNNSVEENAQIQNADDNT